MSELHEIKGVGIKEAKGSYIRIERALNLKILEPAERVSAF